MILIFSRSRRTPFRDVLAIDLGHGGSFFRHFIYFIDMLANITTKRRIHDDMVRFETFLHEPVEMSHERSDVLVFVRDITITIVSTTRSSGVVCSYRSLSLPRTLDLCTRTFQSVS